MSRYSFGSLLLPGKYWQHINDFYGAHDGVLLNAYSVPQVELLQYPSKPFIFKWISMTNGSPLPSTAVQGGHTSDGDPLYVIFVDHSSEYSSGNYNPKKGYGEYEHSGIRATHNFAILVFERGKESICHWPNKTYKTCNI